MNNFWKVMFFVAILATFVIAAGAPQGYGG